MLLEGKVAIVTGAGRGLGRCEALELASQGARVVVNDLGSGADGSGKAEEPAREVVEEIVKMGGEAVAQFGDVANWNDSEALIARAVDTYGGLDILVNNAGFTRDKVLFNMTEDEFDSVVRVHLKGHFCTMRHATAHWRARSKAEGAPVYGRLISTSSEAALFCSASQPNYAAAKSGIIAITMGAAQSCAKYGVTANVIMPRARTRMTTADPMLAAMFEKPEDGFDTFSPDNVTPLISYLASPEAGNISGQVMVIWGKQLWVVERPTLDTCFEREDSRWDHEALRTTLTEYFADKNPMKDGYAIPAM